MPLQTLHRILTFSHISLVFFFSALILGMFFNGENITCLAASQILLIAWCSFGLSKVYSTGVELKKSGLPLTVCVVLFWLCLAVSLLASSVPYVSVANLWWIGSFPLIFLLVALIWQPEESWRAVMAVLLCVGLCLALTAIFQMTVLEKNPEAVFLDKNSLAIFLDMIVLASSYAILGGEKVFKREALTHTALIILIFTVGLTQSRSGLIVLIIGEALICCVSFWLSRNTKRIALLVTLVTLPLLAANLVMHGALGERVHTLMNPYSAGGTRFKIWQGSLEMLQHRPCLGYGLGTFWLAYPPYRHYGDRSGGFHAHNDYLEIWIEAGVPALLSLLAVMCIVLFLFIRGMKSNDITKNKKIELCGLFSALLAVALHSFLNYNLYVLPTLMITALILGRFHIVSQQSDPHFHLMIMPSKWLRKTIYTTVIIVLSLVSVLYFMTIGISYHYYKAAVSYRARGDLMNSYEELTRARQFWPAPDVIWYTQADLLKDIVRELPADRVDARENLFKSAENCLDVARSHNALRPETEFIRGILYTENHSFAGRDWREKSVRSFEHALRLNPRFYAARVAYAQLLLLSGQLREAHVLLEEGMRYSYPGNIGTIIPYYLLTAQVRMKVGDLSGAAELMSTVKEVNKTSDEKQMKDHRKFASFLKRLHEVF